MGMAEPDSGTGQEQARSAEDAREYVRRMRSLPVDQVLGQLRMGQVSAEGHASQQGEPDQQGEPEENDLDRLPAPPSARATQ